jgi:drug/metabolite transporter (DMT)-like permease
MLPYLLAGAAALCYGFATVLQAVGARRAVGAGLGARLLVRLLRQLPYLAGTALDVSGFALSVAALRSLPLFLVQSLVAASVGVTAVAAVLLLRARLRAVEVLALVVLAAGLVLLSVGAQPGAARPLTRAGQVLLLGAALVVAAGASAAGRARGPRAAVGLAAVAGAAFAGVGIAARGLPTPRPWWHLLAAPAAWALAVCGVVGMLAFATALQRGAVTVVAAVVSGTETVLPSAVGLLVLGDSTHGAAGPALTAAGFACALTGVLLLTRYAELEPA